MSFTVEDVLKKYIEMRDAKEALSKQHAEEIETRFGSKMQALEAWLMQKMNETGVDSLPVRGVGTAFRKNAVSVTMQDQAVFKEFIFNPAVGSIFSYLTSAGYTLQSSDAAMVANIVRDMPRWDMVDFRAGKKGIQEYQEQTQTAVPGIAVNTIATVQIRRA